MSLFNHPISIGALGATGVEIVQNTPQLTEQTGKYLQIVIALITIFKLIFPKKEKNINNEKIK